MQLSCTGRHKEITQFPIPPYPAQLRKGKPLDARMLIAVARPIVPTRNGIGTHLHHPKRRGSAGEGLAQSMAGPGLVRIGARPDKRVDIVYRLFTLGWFLCRCC